MILVKNARLIDPKAHMDTTGDILAHRGRILKIGSNLSCPEGAVAFPDDALIAGDPHLLKSIGIPGKSPVVDVSGLAAAPGLVDVHVHFRDPGYTYKEDIYTGALAAKAGGYTTVVMMANTSPVTDNIASLTELLGRTGDCCIHVKACASITKGLKGKELTDLEGLLKAGAVGFTDDGIPLMDQTVLRIAMEKAAAIGCVLSFHEEDPSFIKQNGINHGNASQLLGIYGSDRNAEISMVKRDIELCRETKARVHIQHISCRETVELIRRAKSEGISITAEATPHHFSLTEEAVTTKGTLAKMNPPLRTEADRQAIIQGLADGTVDLIATDHAPHSAEEKSRPITEAPSGITGLQSALGLGLEYLVRRGHMSLMRLIELMSTAPAALYGFDAGYLAPEGPADICLFDPDMGYMLKKEDILSKSWNTPFVK